VLNEKHNSVIIIKYNAYYNQDEQEKYNHGRPSCYVEAIPFAIDSNKQMQMDISNWKDLDAINAITVLVLVISVLCHYLLFLFCNMQIKSKGSKVVETAYKTVQVPRIFKDKYINQRNYNNNTSDDEYKSEESNIKPLLPGPIEVSHLLRTRRYVFL
jgi:hypothetical protein